MSPKSIHQTAKIAALRESLKSAHKRIDDLVKVTDSIQELSKASTAISVEVRLLAQNVTGIAEKLDAVRQEPAKKWDTLGAKIISIAVALAVGYILAG